MEGVKVKVKLSRKIDGKKKSSRLKNTYHWGHQSISAQSCS